MRLRRRLALVMAIAMLAVAVGTVAASADVERYQVTDYELTVTSVNDNTNWGHVFDIRYDYYLESYTGSGTYSEGTESLSLFEMSAGILSFRSDYDPPADPYTWFPAFTLNEGGTLTFVEVAPLPIPPGDNVYAAEGTWTATEYKNHGQYVKNADDKDDKQTAAHSLIGMPVQSQKKNK